jgi:Flp pilus assembly protein TadB
MNTLALWAIAVAVVLLALVMNSKLKGLTDMFSTEFQAALDGIDSVVADGTAEKAAEVKAAVAAAVAPLAQSLADATAKVAADAVEQSAEVAAMVAEAQKLHTALGVPVPDPVVTDPNAPPPAPAA